MNKKNVMVFGSFVVDLMGRTKNLPKPGETVLGSMFKMGPGGKGFNQCVAAHKSGANVKMVTKIGTDNFSHVILDTMKNLDMNTDHIMQADNETTGCALILVEETTSQNEIVVIPGACGTINDNDIASFSHVIKETDIILTQLETNMEATRKVISLGFENNKTIILNPAPAQEIDNETLRMVDIITPNESEAEKITGIPVDTLESMNKNAEFFLQKGVKWVIITLGDKGAYVSDGSFSEIIPAPKVKTVDTTGAGDAFNGGLVSALANGDSVVEAIHFASAVAALSVQKVGTTPSMPNENEINDFLITLK